MLVCVLSEYYYENAETSLTPSAESMQQIYIHLLFRALWERKKKEEEDLLFRDLEELKELSRSKMFGR